MSALNFLSSIFVEGNDQLRITWRTWIWVASFCVFSISYACNL